MKTTGRTALFYGLGMALGVTLVVAARKARKAARDDYRGENHCIGGGADRLPPGFVPMRHAA